MVTRIPLERIFDNPFQTRTDYNDIEELAESIRTLKAVRPETSGLMQVGTARIIIPQGSKGWKVLNPDEYGGVQSTLDDEPDSFVQIAFSHRRFRAFHFLSQTDPDYNTYPLEILPLSDQQMSDLAWEENSRRSDLSPMEKAEAFERAIATFGYTLEELGKRWGLAKSTVSNTMRLLKLPAEAQEAIRRGELTAKHGLALLAAAGKSPTIFQKAMEEIVPPPPIAEEAEEAAKRLVSGRHFWGVNNLNPDASCEACGAPLTDHGYTSGEKVYLCSPCYRAASYTAPSVAEAERTVRSITNRYAVSLERADFPLDIEITPISDEGGGVTWLRSAACTGCAYREGEATCFDRACHDLKSQSWKEAQVEDLKARLARDYGVDPKEVKINYGYNGHDLERRTVDPDLVKVGGPCAPGKCQRLQFHYQTYDSSSKIRVYADLPFIFQCNNANAHAATQRRYQESQKSEAEKSEAVQAVELASARKAEAQAILDQTLTGFAMALQNGHEGAWKALFEELRYSLGDPKPDPYGGAPGYILQFAGKVFRDSGEALKSKWHGWEQEDAVERFQKKISEKLNKYTIAQTPQLVDIIAGLEKIQGFAMSARIAGSLTIEQVEGNRVNVQKLVDQLHELHRAGLLQNNEDFGQVTHLVREALDELWEGAREMDHELPQDWGQEIEAGFNQIVWAIMQLPGDAPKATRRTALHRMRAENAQADVSPENTQEPETVVAS